MSRADWYYTPEINLWLIVDGPLTGADISFVRGFYSRHMRLRKVVYFSAFSNEDFYLGGALGPAFRAEANLPKRHKNWPYFLNFPYTGCPGNIPGTVLPLRITKTPFTITYSIPAENARPFSKLALSATVLGLNTVISASAPTCIL